MISITKNNTLMKCLKNEKTGNIVRVEDRTAMNMVGRLWKYVSKSEWKSKNTKEEEPVQEVIEEKPKETSKTKK